MSLSTLFEEPTSFDFLLGTQTHPIQLLCELSDLFQKYALTSFTKNVGTKKQPIGI